MPHAVPPCRPATEPPYAETCAMSHEHRAESQWPETTPRKLGSATDDPLPDVARPTKPTYRLGLVRANRCKFGRSSAETADIHRFNCLPRRPVSIPANDLTWPAVASRCRQLARTCLSLICPSSVRLSGCRGIHEVIRRTFGTFRCGRWSCPYPAKRAKVIQNGAV